MLLFNISSNKQQANITADPEFASLPANKTEQIGAATIPVDAIAHQTDITTELDSGKRSSKTDTSSTDTMSTKNQSPELKPEVNENNSQVQTMDESNNKSKKDVPDGDVVLPTDATRAGFKENSSTGIDNVVDTTTKTNAKKGGEDTVVGARAEPTVAKRGPTINKLNVANLPREAKRSKSHRGMTSSQQTSPPGLNDGEHKPVWSARGAYTSGKRSPQASDAPSRLRNPKNNAIYQWKRKGETDAEHQQKTEDQTNATRSKKIIMEKGTAAQVPLLLQINRCEDIEAENRLLQENNAKLKKSISALGKEVSCLETAFQKLAQVVKEKLPPEQAEIVKNMIVWVREDAKNGKKKYRKKRRSGRKRGGDRDSPSRESIDKQDDIPDGDRSQPRKNFDDGIKVNRKSRESMTAPRQPLGRGKNAQQKKQFISASKLQQNDADEMARENIRGLMRDAVSNKSLKGLEDALAKAREKGMEYEVSLANKKILQLKEMPK